MSELLWPRDPDDKDVFFTEDMLVDAGLLSIAWGELKNCCWFPRASAVDVVGVDFWGRGDAQEECILLVEGWFDNFWSGSGSLSSDEKDEIPSTKILFLSSAGFLDSARVYSFQYLSKFFRFNNLRLYTLFWIARWKAGFPELLYSGRSLQSVENLIPTSFGSSRSSSILSSRLTGIPLLPFPFWSVVADWEWRGAVFMHSLLKLWD